MSRKTIVQINDGLVEGREDGETATFHGIPYAGPAGGPNYALHPTPVTPWTGVRDATVAGAQPPQPGVSSEPLPGAEYLTVRIDAPWPLGDPRPVLVWLCVGGFVFGRNDTHHIDGNRFARDGVVVVAVTARLGPEGLAVLDDAPDNRSIMDWVAALTWVRDNIAAFGGDPAAVTIAGQSAGAATVQSLLTTSRTRGLFRGAIIMSGTDLTSRSRASVRSSTESFVHRLGVAPTVAGLNSVGYERLMVEVEQEFGPRWRVPEPQRRVHNMIQGPPFRIADDPVLDLHPVISSVASGAGAEVPVLIGATAEEFTASFDPLSPQLSGSALDRTIDEIVPGGSAVLGEYRARFADSSPGLLLGQAFTDFAFRLSTTRFAAARRAASSSPTFVYETGPFPGGASAAHGIDVASVFDPRGAEGGMPAAAAAPFHEACLRFVVSADAGWPSWDSSEFVQTFPDDPRRSEPAQAWARSVWQGVEPA